MIEYNSFKPSRNLAPYIKYYWFLEETGSDWDYALKIIPDACSELIFVVSSGYSRQDLYTKTSEEIRKSCLTGQRSKTALIRSLGETRFIGVRFTPIGFHSLFEIGANYIKDAVISIDDLEYEGLHKIQDQLSEGADQFKHSVQLLNTYFHSRLEKSNTLHLPRYRMAHELFIHLNDRNDTLGTTYKQLGINYKSAQRMIEELIGFSPKEFLRINRFSKAFEALHEERKAYLDFGYFDQSHFIKDCRYFLQDTPLNLHGNIRNKYYGYFTK